MRTLNFNSLVKKLKDKDVYMMIGNGSKNQFRDIKKIKTIVKNIASMCNERTAFLYFGDVPNKKKPDVGLLFELLHQYNSKIPIFMIQIKEAKSWGVPKFVSYNYWHNDYTKTCKWGGIYKGKPCSNTKKWVSLEKRLPNGIRCVFIFGGGAITLDEYKLIKKYQIPYEYFPVERKFSGDGKTKTKKSENLKNKIGITYGKIH